MDLLVTGASGFLGRNFILQAPSSYRILAIYCQDPEFAEFVRRAHRPNVVAARCDLTNEQEVAELFRKYGTDWNSCLYLAAKVDIPWSVRDPAQDLLVNTGALLNVLRCIRVGAFIYFSSGAVYDGLSGEVPPDSPLNPTLPYAISKLACERYVEFYRQRAMTIEKSLTVRFFGAYGPYEAQHKIYTRLIQAFGVERQRNYTIYGDGRNLIDAMYVDDAVAAMIRMIDGNHWNQAVNLAGGRPLPIEELVREVSQVLGMSGVRIDKQGLANESNRFWGSTREMRSFYGFEPKVSLAEGIVRFRDLFAKRAYAAP